MAVLAAGLEDQVLVTVVARAATVATLLPILVAVEVAVAPEAAQAAVVQEDRVVSC